MKTSNPTEEFNLSEKVWNDSNDEHCHNMFYEEDVKEFIRLLKEKLKDIDCLSNRSIDNIIDKLAGDKLI